MKGFIVYHVHGRRAFYQQARFSILSLVDLLQNEGRNDIQILVYADRPTEFAHYPFTQAILMSAAQARTWSGPFRYVHRIKLEVLNHASKSFGLPLLYVDGDTQWLRIPDVPLDLLRKPRKPGEVPPFYMHACEGAITPDAHGEYYRELAAHAPLLQRHGIGDVARWVMWNAGALGVPVGSEGLFKEALELLDDLMKTTRATTYIEQALMSALITARFEVEGLTDYIYHYWNTSKEVQVVLKRFFSSMSSEHDFARELEAYRGFEWNHEELTTIQRGFGHRARLRLGKLRRSVSKRSNRILSKARQSERGE